MGNPTKRFVKHTVENSQEFRVLDNSTSCVFGAQALYHRIEFSLIRRRMERGTYFWELNALEMEEEEEEAK